MGETAVSTGDCGSGVEHCDGVSGGCVRMGNRRKAITLLQDVLEYMVPP